MGLLEYKLLMLMVVALILKVDTIAGWALVQALITVTKLEDLDVVEAPLQGLKSFQTYLIKNVMQGMVLI